jgi:N-acetylmuramoyl-L-alanine amidase
MRSFVIIITLFCLLIIQIACSRSRQETSTNVAPPMATPSPLAPQTVVCIDPGHPSEINSGKTIQNGTSEVHIAWVVALKLKGLLEARGIKVVMTKSEEDQLVLNKERALIANNAGAALMVRLHCDASTDQGFAIYSPDRQGVKDGMVGPSTDVISRSRVVAETIHEAMATSLHGLLKDGGVRGDSKTKIGALQGALTGSIFSNVPVATIEMVVLSNPSDAEFIKSEEGQEKMAQAITEGISKFIDSQVPSADLH